MSLIEHAGGSRFIVEIDWELDEGDPVGQEEVIKQLERSISYALNHELIDFGPMLAYSINSARVTYVDTDIGVEDELYRQLEKEN